MWQRIPLYDSSVFEFVHLFHGAGDHLSSQLFPGYIAAFEYFVDPVCAQLCVALTTLYGSFYGQIE